MEDDSWMQRVEVAEDVAAAGPVRRLAALLDHARAPDADEAPPLAHWLYFLPHARQSELGADGHPAVPEAMARLALPRRMWAGGRLDFLRPIRLGRPISRRSSVLGVRPKEGASGKMIFVTLRHEVSQDQETAVIEEQDLVYRAAAVPGDAARAPLPDVAAPAGRPVTPDAAALFRYSALTFNAHRIHYDRDYARDVEGYPDLVVQGPFIATLLMDEWLRNGGAAPSRFTFRAVAPLFVGRPITLTSRPTHGGGELSALGPGGLLAMSAEVFT